MSAYVTLLLNDGYLKGAQVLGHSLRDLNTQHELVVLVTPHVSESALAGLLDLYDQIIEVEPISNPATDKLDLLGRPDLRASLTKINVWRQVQYQKIVYLDADTIVLQNIDHLFDLNVEFAAAPDIGWPDIFNSGVFFAKPNIGTFAALQRLAGTGQSFDGGDQGLLNTFFPSYHRLSFTYNVTPSASYQYLPAYNYFKSQIKVAHFIGVEKPWHKSPSSVTGQQGSYSELLARWWATFERHYSNTYSQPTIPKIRNRSQFSPPPAVLATIQEEEHASQSPSPAPFEASQTAWDGQSSAPPSTGLPEAGNLQFMSYLNNWDSTGADSAFIPPSTPRIPKSVHFEPPVVLDPAKQVFPWEGKNVAQRSFPEDSIAPLQEIYTIERNPTPQSDPDEPDHPQDASQESFATFQFSNAWDTIQEIKDYVASIPGSSTRPRAPSSTWGSGSNTPREAELPEGPAMSTRIPGAQQSSKTDFLLQEPSGVPRPQDWNPSAQLDALAARAARLAQQAAERVTQTVDASVEVVKETVGSAPAAASSSSS